MAHVLGRVTRPAPEVRGPDACYELSLPQDWLDRGASIELELPRRAACAVCRGGGCDTCGRSGAVSLRAENEPAERLVITLPQRRPAAAVVLRIPERGGLPDSADETCRGQLLLHITPGTRAPENVTLGSQPPLEGLGRRRGMPGSISRAPWVVLAIVLLVGALLVSLMGGP
jgi:hypothetical protein